MGSVAIRLDLGKRSHHSTFFEQPVDRATAQRVVLARISPVVEPVIELQLEVQLGGKAPPALEAALHEVLQPLDTALRVRRQLRLKVLLESELSV